MSILSRDRINCADVPKIKRKKGYARS